ncbi:hypothetical protein [Marinimicrobium alkaliphilum]|uniref:hypothetical protein n=1 Tax=Marinimicrobium alkaliphilum TaxID=2202654 RepID=UPI0013005F1A|nr:hypothetical protein [Marinimicrobium alkaliphilum]
MTRDKRIIIGIIFGFFCFSVFSWIPGPEVKDIVRTTLLIVLSTFLYLGHSWSRWVIGSLSVLAATLGIFSLLSTPGNIAQAIILGIMSCFYFYAAFYLLNPRLLTSHFKE